jgi:hypothetical protein
MDDSQDAGTLSAAVGPHQTNTKPDVLLIQRLINHLN